jgi:hypothetical protein
MEQPYKPSAIKGFAELTVNRPGMLWLTVFIIAVVYLKINYTICCAFRKKNHTNGHKLHTELCLNFCLRFNSRFMQV